MKTIVSLLLSAALLLSLAACQNGEQPYSSQSSESPTQFVSSLPPEVSSAPTAEPSQAPSPSPAPTESLTLSQGEQLLQMTVGGQSFLADLADTEAAKSLVEMLPMTLEMADFQNIAKRFSLPSAFSLEEQSFSSVQAGQLLLEGSGTLCLFYNASSQSGEYTPLATFREPEALAQALAGDTVEITFQLTVE